MSPATRRHFLALDALRGVAAFCVMFFHVSGQRLTCGYLGVDLFFVLSGFVIAFSYQDKLDRGFSFGAFMLRRFVRLYPMILAGSLGGLVAALALYFDEARAYPRDLLEAFLASLVILPHPRGTAFGIETFPINTVFWSLFFEVAANIVYAAGLYRLRLPAVAALAGACLLAIGFLGQLGGVQVQNFWAGFPRVGFGFFAGVALFHAWRAGLLPAVRLRLIPLACILVGIFLIPVELEGFTAVPALAAFVAIVGVAVQIEDDENDARALAFLGALSYPLYALHMPLYWLIKAAAPGLVAAQGIMFVPAIAAVCAFVVGVSWLAARFVDAPMRGWLTRRLTARPTAPVSAPV